VVLEEKYDQDKVQSHWRDRICDEEERRLRVFPLLVPNGNRVTCDPPSQSAKVANMLCVTQLITQSLMSAFSMIDQLQAFADGATR
jgi:hypothetical protein